MSGERCCPSRTIVEGAHGFTRQDEVSRSLSRPWCGPAKPPACSRSSVPSRHARRLRPRRRHRTPPTSSTPGRATGSTTAAPAITSASLSCSTCAPGKGSGSKRTSPPRRAGCAAQPGGSARRAPLRGRRQLAALVVLGAHRLARRYVVQRRARRERDDHDSRRLDDPCAIRAHRPDPALDARHPRGGADSRGAERARDSRGVELARGERHYRARPPGRAHLHVDGQAAPCARLLGHREHEWLLHELFHLAATRLRWNEAHLGQRLADRRDESLVARAQNLE